MKNDVDKRVVEFEFDNSNFDKNVKKSTKTLNKLDETLQFKDVSKSLDVIKMKFSTFEVVAASVTKNITDRVVNLGVRLVKSLSVDNLIAGWQKFGDKTIAVGTLMAQKLKVAGKEIEGYSEQFEVVNEQLDKLNWFTDETSYNFTDMVDNIGKFTAAGQDLDKSVEAMMGIANWAAVSGQNASTASRAMYQLSQALGKGYVQLIDYKSIQNANMDTQEFRKTVLETAVAFGELTKEGENYLTKTGKKFNQNQFAEQLNAKWFTSDVLTASLKKYSGAVDKLYEITEKEGITASEAIELYGDQFDELAIKAFKAAQEARTFSDAIKSVKDAVSTGWMTTAEMIFGSYDEAKEFWTQLANELYDVFAKSGQIRNEILSIWKALEGRSDLFTRGGSNQGAFWNLYDSLMAVRDAISNAWRTIFPRSDLEDEDAQISDIAHNLKIFTSNLQQATKRVKDFFENNNDLQRILQGVFSILKVFLATVQSIRCALDPIIVTIKELALVISDMFADIGDQLSSSTGYAEILYNVATKINNVLTNIFVAIDLPGVLKKVVSILGSLGTILKSIFNTISDFFKGKIKLGDIIENISVGLSELINRIKDFFSQFKKGSSKSKNSGILSSIFGSDANKNLEDSSEKASETLGILDTLKEFAISLLNLLKSFANIALSVIQLATGIFNIIANALNKFAKTISGIANIQDETNASLKNFLKIASGLFIFAELIKLFINLKWMAAYLRINVYAFLDEAATALSRWGTAQIIRAIGFDLIALASSFMIVILALHRISEINWDDMGKAGAIFAVMVAAVALLTLCSKKISRSFSLLKKESGLLTRNAESTTLTEISSVLISLGLSFWLIARSLSYFKELEETKDSFKRVLIVLGILSVLAITLQLLSKKLNIGGNSVRRMLPSMLQLIGFALSLKILAGTYIKITKMLKDFTLAMKGRFVLVVVGFTALIAGLIAINNITRKANNAAGPLSSVTISLGLKLGFTLMGIASVLLSATLFVYTIASLGEAAKAGLIWVSSIIGGIIIAMIILEVIMNSGIKKLASLKKNPIQRKNPIAGILASISLFLLSLSVSLLILQNIDFNEKLVKVLKKVSDFIIGILVVLSLFPLIFRDRKTSQISEFGNFSKSSAISKSNAISEMIKSLSVLLLAMAGVLLLVYILPDDSRIKKISNTLMVFVIAVLGMLALIAKQTKGSHININKSLKPISVALSVISVLASFVAAILLLKDIGLAEMAIAVGALMLCLAAVIGFIIAIDKIKTDKRKIKKVLSTLAFISLNIILFSASIVALSGALLAMNTFVKPDWEKFGYLASVLALFFGSGALLGGLLKIKQSGMAALSGNIALFGVALATLTGALYSFQNSVKPDWVKFGYLAAVLALFFGIGGGLGGAIPVFSILMQAGMALFSINVALFGAALLVLARALRDFQTMVKPDWESFGYLAAVLGLVAAFGFIGGLLSLLGGVVTFGTNMAAMGLGLLAMVDPMNKLTYEGIENLNTLLSSLTKTSVKGILERLFKGNDALGRGLISIASGLRLLIDPMNSLKEESIKNLSRLLDLLNSGKFATLTSENWLGLGKSDRTKIKEGLTGIGEGMQSIANAATDLDLTNGITNLAKIIEITNTKYDTDTLSKIANIISSITVPDSDSLNALNEIISKIASINSIKDDFVIKPKIDLTDFNAGYNHLSEMLTSLSGKGTSVSSNLAYKVLSDKTSGSNGTNSIINNTNTTSNDTYTITMNIETNDPYKLAEELDKILQQKRTNNRLSQGFQGFQSF